MDLILDLKYFFSFPVSNELKSFTDHKIVFWAHLQDTVVTIMNSLMIKFKLTQSHSDWYWLKQKIIRISLLMSSTNGKNISKFQVVRF